MPVLLAAIPGFDICDICNYLEVLIKDSTDVNYKQAENKNLQLQKAESVKDGN